MPRKTDVATEAKDNSRGDSASIDDHTLPKSIVTRLAKGVLPRNTNVQKDAVLALSKGGTVFINYLCSTANDHAKLHGRKTIAPKDILEAMRIMEFDDFLPRLEAELEKFNEATTEKRAATRKAAKDKDKQPGTRSDGEQLRNDDDTDSPRAAKKLRTAGSGALDASQAIPSRGWGDSESEINEDEDVIEDEEDVGVSDVEEEEAELDKDEDEVESLEEEQPAAEDEALDNGYDSD